MKPIRVGGIRPHRDRSSSVCLCRLRRRMMMMMMVKTTPGRVLFILSVTLFAAAAQKHKVSPRPEWEFRNEERVNSRGCSNLTLVLDNWKYAIMTQVKDLLLHDHSTVLPDYGRIQHLSDALGDLYREFNALKERLAELTAKFDGVEAFVDQVRSGRKPAAPRGETREEGEAAAAGGRPQGRRRSRVVVRRVVTPAASQD
ncbi:uncharacterized protein LOC118287216 isoform X2 [Scophthalmus maximus]|uniref:uncharacterized protein LOC118287216 isoform X2 n=1 Tax=Scophthalmus maximus TaxID=52904 RepID=UPI0015E07272|nr:uncharacterized protein LOC118287216 isoform X2 [Scophthalmus maximus]